MLLSKMMLALLLRLLLLLLLLLLPVPPVPAPAQPRRMGSPKVGLRMLHRRRPARAANVQTERPLQTDKAPRRRLRHHPEMPGTAWDRLVHEVAVEPRDEAIDRIKQGFGLPLAHIPAAAIRQL